MVQGLFDLTGRRALVVDARFVERFEQRLALLVVVVHRRRRFSEKDLHPPFG